MLMARASQGLQRMQEAVDGAAKTDEGELGEGLVWISVMANQAC